MEKSEINPKEQDVCLYPECPSGAKHISLREKLEEIQRSQRESHKELKEGQEKLFEILSTQKAVLFTLSQHSKEIDELRNHKEKVHTEIFAQLRTIERDSKEFVTKDDVNRLMIILTVIFAGIEVLLRIVWK